MRTDCVIDARQVICPNASLLGYGKRIARVGYYLLVDGSDHKGIARMLGRIKYAPMLSGDKSPVKNFILAMCLSQNGRHAFERWIDPTTVLEVYENPPTEFAAFFFAPKIPYDAQTMRRLMEHGTICDRFIGRHADNVAMFRDRDANAQAYREQLDRERNEAYKLARAQKSAE